jgi:hypothetical protein
VKGIFPLISSHWRTDKDRIFYDVVVPPNTSASLMLPLPVRDVLQSGRPLDEKDAEVTNITLPAGIYNFSFPGNIVLHK